MGTPLLEALLSPGFWTFAAVAVVSICSCIAWTNRARHMHRPHRILAEAELLRARRQEDRLDRAQEAHIELLTQLASGMQFEADRHVPPMPAPQETTAPVSPQVEKRAA